MNFLRLENGEWDGADDCSYVARFAHDSKYLYIAGIVRDQLWFNAGGPDNPWVGDDLEVYIDSNPVDKQFQKDLNENDVQFIFIPDHISQNGNGVFIWRADRYPGVMAASRLTPLGYTLEIAIPKDVHAGVEGKP